MSEHRYILEPYKGMNTRYHCPNCQAIDKTFSLYIDKETGEHIHPSVGRCNRESKCGYHYTPKQFFQENRREPELSNRYAHAYTRARRLPPKNQSKEVSFISVEVFKASLKAHETNHFVKFLIKLFGAEVVSKVVSQYFIGTSSHWNGATVFWQIDTQGKVRTGKIMLYSHSTGKRVKEPFNHINWAHKALKQPEFELKQCMFGEHLLIDKTKPIAIVESEKTAIIASIYLPQFIWLAVGSLTNLNVEKCKILKGRTVILFPDLNGFDKWSSKAKELSHLAIFTVSDLLERKATEAEKKQAFDIADYLIKFNYKDFIQPKALIHVEQPNVLLSSTEYVPICTRADEVAIGWNIKELETFFSEIDLPTEPLKLNQCGTITRVAQFIESHLSIVKANNGNQTFLPYLNRLQELKQLLITEFSYMI